MAKNSELSAFASNRYKGLSFDQLNALYDAEHDRMSMDYDEYFGDMDLSDEQKDRRRDSAEDLEEVFEVLLALVLYLYMEEAYDYSEAIAEAQEAYQDILAGADVSDYYREVHVPNAVNGVVNTMLQNPDNPFNFSVDRAIMIAENEANSIWNDAEYEEALRSGKKRKTWHTIIDKRTRDWHAEVNGQTKQITEPFEVNGELLQFPRDESLGASGGNIVNCRCSVTYS
jgi:uncharacterized protein with gpF-like domain